MGAASLRLHLPSINLQPTELWLSNIQLDFSTFHPLQLLSRRLKADRVDVHVCVCVFVITKEKGFPR